MIPNLNNIETNNLRELSLFLLISNQNNDKKLSEQLELLHQKISLPDPRNYHFISEILNGVYKRMITLDAILEFLIKKDFKKLPVVILNILRIGLYQLLFMESIPVSAAINESVKLAKKYGHAGTVKLTNAVLRNVIRKKNEIDEYINSLDFKKQISIKYSLPDWLTDYWLKSYSADTVRELAESLLETPALFLRINTLKIPANEFKDKLKELNINFAETIIEEAVELRDRLPLKEIYGYQEGLWYVQDLGAMLVSHVLSAEPESFIIDLCAFPGGKTTHISQLMNNSGEILVIDSNKNRELKFIENTQRLGNKNIRTLIQSATLPIETEKKADKILVDPPCSGLGVIRRKAEIKYRNSLKDLQRLAELQAEILQNASKYLKIGGELVYSTCTLSKIENEDVIEKFLKVNNNFRLKKINLFNEEKEFYNLFPFKHGTDGFFMAKLERIE
jgi:16S rRNA (cytosine967-C5)-methyltransferase